MSGFGQRSRSASSGAHDPPRSATTASKPGSRGSAPRTSLVSARQRCRSGGGSRACADLLKRVSPDQATTIQPGAFTAPATGADLLRIETGPVPGTPQADPILHVFDPTDLEVWFAVNDDFEVDSPYPALVLDPGDRTELLIRVSGAEDDQGTYHLKVSRGAVDETLAVEGARDRDLFEEEDSPEKARRLPMGHSRIRQIGALRPDGTRDQDWFRVVLREE